MKKKKKFPIKSIVGLLLIALGVFGGIYVGAWLMFIKPIILVCMAIDSGTITATIIGITVVKCLLASFVGYIIAIIGVVSGQFLLED